MLFVVILSDRPPVPDGRAPAAADEGLLEAQQAGAGVDVSAYEALVLKAGVLGPLGRVLLLDDFDDVCTFLDARREDTVSSRSLDARRGTHP